MTQVNPSFDRRNARFCSVCDKQTISKVHVDKVDFIGLSAINTSGFCSTCETDVTFYWKRTDTPRRLASQLKIDPDKDIGHVNSYEFFKEERDVLSEKNDCSVIALAVAIDVSYDEAHELCKRMGRKHARRFWFQRMTHMLPEKIRLRFKFITRSECNLNVQRFIEKYPTGTYYVLTNTHAFVIKDSTVYDWCKKPLRRIKCAFEII